MEEGDIVTLIDRLDKMDRPCVVASSQQAHIQFPAGGPNPFHAYVCFTLSEYIGYVVDHK